MTLAQRAEDGDDVDRDAEVPVSERTREESSPGPRRQVIVSTRARNQLFANPPGRGLTRLTAPVEKAEAMPIASERPDARSSFASCGSTSPARHLPHAGPGQPARPARPGRGPRPARGERPRPTAGDPE